jgi:hypothetical protein
MKGYGRRNARQAPIGQSSPANILAALIVALM